MSWLMDAGAWGANAMGFTDFGATLSTFGSSVDTFFDENEWIGKGLTSGAKSLAGSGEGGSRARSNPGSSVPRDIFNASQARQSTQDPLTAGKGRGIRSEDPEAVWAKWQSRMNQYARNK
jgi:hypothetical protein